MPLYAIGGTVEGGLGRFSELQCGAILGNFLIVGDVQINGDGSSGSGAALQVNAQDAAVTYAAELRTSSANTGGWLRLIDSLSPETQYVVWNLDSQIAQLAMLNPYTATVTYTPIGGSAATRGAIPMVGDDISGSVDSGQMKVVSEVAQAAAIGATDLTNGTAAGYYVVDWTLLVTTADVTAGSIQFGIAYTDTLGATTQAGAVTVLTATGRDRGSFQVQLASGNITYNVALIAGAVNAARFALYVRCTFLG